MSEIYLEDLSLFLDNDALCCRDPNVNDFTALPSFLPAPIIQQDEHVLKIIAAAADFLLASVFGMLMGTVGRLLICLIC